MINIIPLRAFNDNYIWLFHEEGSQSAWIVDPGEAQPVLDALKKYNLILKGILITHHHPDHTGGISELLSHTGDIPVWGSEKSPISTVNSRIKEGDQIVCGPLNFTVIEIPGHTLDHVAYYGQQILFSGDTLFSAGCGRVFEGTYPQMYATLTKLAMLPGDTQVFCGHEYTLANLQFAQHVEPENQFISQYIDRVKTILARGDATLPSLLTDEKKMNPFLRCNETKVIESVSAYSGEHVTDPISVFSKLRDWKNQFVIK